MKMQKRENKNFLFFEVKAQASVHKLSNHPWASSSRKCTLRTLSFSSKVGKKTSVSWVLPIIPWILHFIVTDTVFLLLQT